jgi:hypothetical protein
LAESDPGRESEGNLRNSRIAEDREAHRENERSFIFLGVGETVRNFTSLGFARSSFS